MRCRSLCRPGLGLALVFALSPLLLAADPAAGKTQHFKGKVVPLARVLEKFGARLDPDAAAAWLALAADDGKVYPLIKDDGSRMFFADPKLLDRPMRLTGRLHPPSGLLQVFTVRSYVNGKLHDVYYWCDVCSIRRNEKKICDCCNGPMTFREEPVDD